MTLKFFVEEHDDQVSFLPTISDDVLEMLEDEDINRHDLQLTCHYTDLDELAVLLDLDLIVPGNVYDVDPQVYLETISNWLYAQDIESWYFDDLDEWDLPDWSNDDGYLT